LGAALGHLGEAVAQEVELGVDRLLGGQLLVGVALRRDQLLADLGGTDASEEPLGLELGVGLALAIGDGLDVVEQVGQVVLHGPTPAGGEGIEASQAAVQLVPPLADGDPAPAEMFLGPALSAWPQGFDGLGHEDPSLMAFEGLGRIDEDGDHLRGGSHLRSS